MKTNTLTIRLDADQDAQLTDLAKRFKVSKAIVVGWAIDALADYAKLHGGRITMPINFEEYWRMTQNNGPSGSKHTDGFAADVDHLSKAYRLNEKETEYPTSGSKKRVS